MPQVACPASFSIGSMAVETYTTPAATDNVDTSLSVTCSPVSGHTDFDTEGITTVTCMSTDTSANTGTCTFVVTVTGGNDTTLRFNIVYPWNMGYKSIVNVHKR